VFFRLYQLTQNMTRYVLMVFHYQITLSTDKGDKFTLATTVNGFISIQGEKRVEKSLRYILFQAEDISQKNKLQC